MSKLVLKNTGALGDKTVIVEPEVRGDAWLEVRRPHCQVGLALSTDEARQIAAVLDPPREDETEEVPVSPDPDRYIVVDHHLVVDTRGQSVVANLNGHGDPHDVAAALNAQEAAA